MANHQNISVYVSREQLAVCFRLNLVVEISMWFNQTLVDIFQITLKFSIWEQNISDGGRNCFKSV